MKKPVSIKNESIETSVLKDYKKALCEYIWNGFEAEASNVNISYEVNPLEGIERIIVEDDGKGIIYENLNDTFGAFMASVKNVNKTGNRTKENQGRGRFSIFNFADTAVWSTNYENDGRIYNYELRINTKDKINYEIVSDKRELERNTASTGTEVSFYGIKGIIPSDLNYIKLCGDLLKDFAWYLYIYQNKKILVGGTELDYSDYINLGLSINKTIYIDEYSFKICIIVWKKKINERYLVYYVYGNNIIDKRFTTYNNNAVDFIHSVYVESDFFQDTDVKELSEDSQISIYQNDDYKKVKRELDEQINRELEEVYSNFLKERSNEYINRVKERNSYPVFEKGYYGELREKDFKNVVQAIYETEPKLFTKLKPIQEKSLLGFINLLLTSDEREGVLKIIESIVNLTEEQRRTFVDILNKTKLENILDMVKFIENRYIIINGLKKIIYNCDDFANERDHIQRIIERNYWLFGERYNLVTADETMQKSLEKYTDNLYKGEIKAKVEDVNKLKRMDVFLTGKQKVEDLNGSELEENLILELKAPKVKLTVEVLRQIQDYMYIVANEKEFNTQLRVWKFIAICSELDDYVKYSLEEAKDKGKRFLVTSLLNYEIYVMTWADVFKDFELRHSFLLDKLKYDCNKIQGIIDFENSDPSRSLADEITERILNISPQEV